MPPTKVSRTSWARLTAPVSASTPMRAAVSAWPAPVAMSRRWRGRRSAITPAGTPTKKSGRARAPIAAPTRKGESVSSSASQPSTTSSPIMPMELSSVPAPR